MKRYKKASGILCLALVLCFTPICAVASDEVSYIDRLHKLTPYNFNYSDDLTRETVCVVIAQLFMEVPTSTSALPFADADTINPENINSLTVLYEKGILAGAEDNGKLYMYPDAPIMRQDAIALLGRALFGNAVADDYSHNMLPYASGYVNLLAEQNIGSSYFDNLNPSGNITAGEFAELVMHSVDFEKINSVKISTLSGTGARGITDGNAKTASFLMPGGVLYDTGKNTLLVLDTYNNAIRQIDNASAKTIAGIVQNNDSNGLPKGNYLNGTLKSALLNRPTGGVINSKGEVFICDSVNNAIRLISDNKMTTFSGGGKGFADGKGANAKFDRPMALAIDKNDNIYVADALNNCIRRITPSGEVTTIAGSPKREGYSDGNASSAMFRSPCGIAVDSDGTLYVADTGNHVIRIIKDGKVSTFAGKLGISDEDGYPLGGFADGIGKSAAFNLPMSLAMSNGILIVADSANNAIRAIDSGGYVSTIVGNGEPGDYDGSAREATLNTPSGVCIGGSTLYIADTNNNKIKKMSFDYKLYNISVSQQGGLK